MTKYVGWSRVCGGMRRKDIAILGGQRLQYDGEQGTDMTHMNLGHRVFAFLFAFFLVLREVLIPSLQICKLFHLSLTGSLNPISAS